MIDILFKREENGIYTIISKIRSVSVEVITLFFIISVQDYSKEVHTDTESSIFSHLGLEMIHKSV